MRPCSIYSWRMLVSSRRRKPREREKAICPGADKCGGFGPLGCASSASGGQPAFGCGMSWFHAGAITACSRLGTHQQPARRQYRRREGVAFDYQIAKVCQLRRRALALQRLGASRTQRDEVSRLLAKEYVIWQITRAREKADALLRLVQEGHATPTLLYARASEIQALSNLPRPLLQLATGSPASKNEQSQRDLRPCSLRRTKTPMPLRR
jgi:hypothetical protein